MPNWWTNGLKRKLCSPFSRIFSKKIIGTCLYLILKAIFIINYCTASRKYFNPVSCRWQKRICAKFGIGVKSSLPTGHFKVLAKPTKRVHAKMDGNCFYRSLSVWVTGDQSAHALLRQELVKVGTCYFLQILLHLSSL